MPVQISYPYAFILVPSGRVAETSITESRLAKHKYFTGRVQNFLF